MTPADNSCQHMLERGDRSFLLCHPLGLVSSARLRRTFGLSVDCGYMQRLFCFAAWTFDRRLV